MGADGAVRLATYRHNAPHHQPLNRPATGPADAVLDALATVGASTEDLEPETTESDGDDEDYAVAV